MKRRNRTLKRRAAGEGLRDHSNTKNYSRVVLKRGKSEEGEKKPTCGCGETCMKEAAVRWVPSKVITVCFTK